MNQTLNRWMLFLIPVIFMIVNPWQLNELGLWIGYGQRLWSDWHYLYHDSSTILPTDNNITSAWLPALLYYAIFSLTGIYGIALFHVGILVTALKIVYKRSIFINPWPWTATERIFIYLMWIGSAAYYSFRPALFSFIPFCLSYLIIQRMLHVGRFNRQQWMQLIAIQIVWVNLHGSFILLPLMLGWTLVVKRDFSILNVVGYLGLLTSNLLNPFGFGIFKYVTKTKEFSEILGIAEWVSAFSFDFPTQSLCYWLLFISVIYFLFINRDRFFSVFASPQIPLLLVSILSLRASVFLFFALPIFVLNQTQIYQPRSANKEMPLAGTMFGFLSVLLIGLSCSPLFKANIRNYLPDKLSDSFDEFSLFKLSSKIKDAHLNTCPILNDINVGGFLMMTLPNPLLIDGRITAFQKQSLFRYLNFIRHEDKDEVVKYSKACFAILDGTQQKNLILHLETKFNFKFLGSEKDFVLLGR